MQPTTDIKQFISNIVNKNYKAANDSLEQMVQHKLKERIKACLDHKN